MPADEDSDRVCALANDILKESRNALMLTFRFLDIALWKMPFLHDAQVSPIAIDGSAFHYNAIDVIRCYMQAPNEVTRTYLHCIFHCIFHHPFVDKEVISDDWDLACDIAVEAVIIELCGKRYPSNEDFLRSEVIERFSKTLGILTAARIYQKIQDDRRPADDYAFERAIFFRDDHRLWRSSDGKSKRKADEGDDSDTSDETDETGAVDGQEEEDEIELDGSKRSDEGEPEETDTVELGGEEADAQAEDGEVDEESQSSEGDTSSESTETSDEVEERELREISELSDEDEEQWEEISKQVELDLESYSKKWGDKAGLLVKNLVAVNRQHYDYADFLKRFAVLDEDLKINDDEFDYIFYTYGLDHYGNMPLIEPLEYKEVKRIREFAIALDTSGSCSGDLIKAFVTKTYNILKQSEGFHERVCIHIVQCDAQIQNDLKITSLSELDECLESFEVKGFGGTNFVPVFDYVDGLIREGEFQNLRGLIYFTDGYGVFPTHPPDYDTVFVFIDDGYNNLEVPAWAMKIILDRDQI